MSAGWQLGMKCDYNSANASVRQITIDHTHYDTLAGVAAATELYGRVFRPTVHDEIYAFADLPRAISEMHHNTLTGRDAADAHPPDHGEIELGRTRRSSAPWYCVAIDWETGDGALRPGNGGAMVDEGEIGCQLSCAGSRAER